MLKNLLVHIPSESLIRPVVDGAISLAVACAAHLDAVSIGYETANVGLAVDSGAAVAAVFELERERALARACGLRNRSAQRGHKLWSQGAHGSSGRGRRNGRRLGTAVRSDNRAAARGRSRYVRQYHAAGNSFSIRWSGSLHPTTHKGPIELKRICIAWDGSRLAARAVRDAAEFLTRAHAITIISINEAQKAANAPAATLAAHLARHGLTTQIERGSADRADIQPTILSIAADKGLDLIVMGGYGHSRLQERILGGVTRGMLQSMTVPTLMSH